jgi:hypothetical protein
MNSFFKSIYVWIYIKIHSFFLNLGIALYNTEVEILKANPNNLGEKDKKITRKLHHNPLLEKFYAGQRDEKYVQTYYELLEKAEKFRRKATQHKMEVAAYKYNTNYGMKDQYGRRYEHYGFFDDKHKHSGKTIGEVLELELKERKTNDDNLQIIYIFNNNPIDVGLSGVIDFVEKDDNDQYQACDIKQKSKSLKFPIKIHRDNDDVVNKIEQLCELLHVKKIGFNNVQLEFFIPIKYNTGELSDDSEIFKELINVDSVYVKDELGKLISFGQIKYKKRILHNDMYDVIKFDGVEMEIMC